MDRDAISGWGAVVHIIEKDKVKLDFDVAIGFNWFQNVNSTGDHPHTENQDGLKLFKLQQHQPPSFIQ